MHIYIYLKIDSSLVLVSKHEYLQFFIKGAKLRRTNILPTRRDKDGVVRARPIEFRNGPRSARQRRGAGRASPGLKAFRERPPTSADVPYSRCIRLRQS